MRCYAAAIWTKIMAGEALIVSAGAAVALALYRNAPRRLGRLLAVEAALVCISRVYVGGHYPLDVVGGILLGVGVSFIFVGIEKRIESLIMPIVKILKKPKLLLIVHTFLTFGFCSMIPLRNHIKSSM